MHITKIKAQGFKNFYEPIEYVFNGNNIDICADNWTGKTTIKEIIIFAICGTDTYGSNQTDSLYSVDSSGRPISNALDVQLDFVDNDGKDRTIRRLKSTKKHEVRLDDRPCSQNDLSDLFGIKHLFLSVFNIGYFNAILSPDEKRALISRFADDVDKEEMYNTLIDGKLNSNWPVDFNKDLKKEHKKYNDERLREESNWKDKNAKIEHLKLELAQINESVPIEPLDEEVSSLRDTLDKLTEDISNNEKLQVQIDTYNEQLKRVTEIQEANNEKMALITKLQKPLDHVSKPKISAKHNKAVADRASKKAMLDIIISDDELKNADGTNINCPTCLNKISKEDAQTIIKTKVDLKNDIKELDEQISKATKEFNKKTQEHNDYVLNEKERQLKLENISLESMPQLTKPSGEFKKVDNYDDIKEKHDELVSKNEKIKEHNAIISNDKNRKTRYQNEIATLQTDIEGLNIKLSDLSVVCKVLSEKGLPVLIIKNQIKAIQSELLSAKIVLFKKDKSDNIKPAFDIYYKNKPYSYLSNAEKILCDLEISQLLNNRSKLNFSIFIDNAESITQIPSKFTDNKQIFRAFVKAGEKLTVTSGEDLVAKEISPIGDSGVKVDDLSDILDNIDIQSTNG